MKAYTICCNDWIVAISIESEVKARRIMRTYMRRDYEHKKRGYKNTAEYKQIQYWHLHYVRCH
jgi:hypothetical protein